MYYSCVLLKDYPGYSKGTEFTLYENDCSKELIGLKGEKSLIYPHPLCGILKHKDWYSKTVKEDRLTELSCPKCNSNKGFISLCEADSRRDDGVEYCKSNIKIECKCGEVYSLGIFTTHSRLC